MLFKIEKYWWDLERFGLTPQKILRRLISRNNPKILCVSIPKAGTHLLERVLCLHPYLYRSLLRTLNPDNVHQYEGLAAILRRQRAGQILVSHLYYSEENHDLIVQSDVKCIFMIRDPRDILVSDIFYIEKNEGHHLHDFLSGLPTFKDKLKYIIEGDASIQLPPFCEIMNYFIGWLDTDCLIVRFEDLVETSPHAQKLTQIKTLQNIFDYLELAMDDERIVG